MNSMIKQVFPFFSEDTPGCAVMASQNGKVLLNETVGMANMEERIPITPQTAFRLASLTKQFTAMAIMLLKDKRLLHYGDSLSDFFPDYPPYGKQVTIRQLLLHTAGIPDHEKLLETYLSEKQEPTINDALDVLKTQASPLFPSGNKYMYSDAGYVLLALIIEKVTGETYASFLSENIFKHLGLKNTLVVDQTKPSIDKRAIGYRKTKNSWEVYDYNPLNYIVGDEGIYSCMEDLMLWKEAWRTEILVSKTTLQEALTNGIISSHRKSISGFSWFIKETATEKLLFHTGTWVGFNNIFVMVPEQNFAAAMLSNTNMFPTIRKKRNVLNKILQTLELPLQV